MEKARKDIEKLRTKLDKVTRFKLEPEARRLLRLYAEGLHDWEQPPYRRPTKKLYMEALEKFGPELGEGLTHNRLYWFLFMIQFRGGRDSETAAESVTEAWALARKISPSAVEELIEGSGLYSKKEKKKFLKDLDELISIDQQIKELEDQSGASS